LSEQEAAQPGILGAGFTHLASLAELVKTQGACHLPGCSISFEVFVPLLLRAASRRFVDPEKAAFVVDGLRHGFMCGVDVSLMRGKRQFRNYPSALAAVDKVSAAVGKRVAADKTLCLGAFREGDKQKIPFEVYCVFPMGGVRKKMEDAVRPVDDHTRTLLNKATDLSGLRFSLRTHGEVAEFLSGLSTWESRMSRMPFL
jgi:hypothetical protein